jgi:exodeoxyribonuclease VII small subunit
MFIKAELSNPDLSIKKKGVFKMAEQSFEKALEELENIVLKLEEGGLKLNESLVLFEKGVKLARFLREELDKAERKIEILLKDEKGGIKAERFETPPEKDGSSDKENDSGPDGNNTLPF